MGMTEGGELASEAPQPTHIDVHIHQESALVKHLLTGCSWLQPPARKTPGSSRLLVASWVVQIVLGVLSGVLGGFLYLCNYSILLGSGAAIWAGAVAVLAGAVAFIYEKQGGICWALLRTLLALAAFSTAIAAIVSGADSFLYGYSDGDYICSCNSPSERWYTPPPSTQSPEEVRRLHLCTSYMNMLQALFIGLQAMLLGIWVLLLLASLAPVWLYCWRRLPCKEEKDQKKLLEVSGS
ncbi:PREDICTED: transmembrane protein 176A [Propithecus coquereli]|uniref:Transmembrane protein 176A n=1 Tax=Propithecus coquereli TaxID=379532 RepID=A0A2K6GIT0_PROCO|nr:PREDICTED: transmembrane protein 176A [Propithecus coquereli]XP_012517615.1 PREDICTED: transmembrane protein 176A [Propithecus coquereli]XP_012517616.1 PREDICTED: transmembrane protein 176A [Propithecus coquereli]XP_012517617.1 PREDICTED: transmembrane protein 176A [Propithecus coquereli]